MISNAASPVLFTFQKPGEAISITARTSMPWDTAFTWIGYDDSGYQSSSIPVVPYISQIPMDSGLAKIWAGDENHIADFEDVYPGGTFGIVTKATFLQAGKNNTGGGSGVSVDYLRDDEIFAPRTSVKKVMSAAPKENIRIYCTSGFLTIEAPRSFTILKIFDLRGRLIAQILLSSIVARNNFFAIPVASLVRDRSINKVIVRLEGNDCMHSTIVSLRGAR